MTTSDLVTAVTIHHAPHIKLSDIILREQQTAIESILYYNVFSPADTGTGPYELELQLDNDRLHITIDGANINIPKTITLPMRPYRKMIKDYFMICDSYDKAYTSGDAARLEPIDMARRALHDEGAGLLKDRLKAKGIDTDHDTARNIFTLICILHIGGVRQW